MQHVKGKISSFIKLIAVNNDDDLGTIWSIAHKTRAKPKDNIQTKLTS